jgi:hypothetical protein
MVAPSLTLKYQTRQISENNSPMILTLKIRPNIRPKIRPKIRPQNKAQNMAPNKAPKGPK